jgi:hypothetical protein
MSTRKKFLGLVVCFFLAVFIGSTLSQTPRPNYQLEPINNELLQSMNHEQRRRYFEQRAKQREIERQQRQVQNEKRSMRIAKGLEQNQGQRQIETKKCQEQAMKEALKATDEQWKLIKPRLERVKELVRLSEVSLGIYTHGVASAGGAGGFSGGGGGTSDSGSSRGAATESKNESSRGSFQFASGWSRPSYRKSPEEMNEGERACEELLDVLENKSSKPEEIEQKMENLRNIRQKANEELIKARQELRDVLTYRQEAALIMMWWLH